MQNPEKENQEPSVDVTEEALLEGLAEAVVHQITETDLSDFEPFESYVHQMKAKVLSDPLLASARFISGYRILRKELEGK